MRRVRSRDAETGLYTVEEVDTQRVITLVPLEYFFSGNPEQVDGFVHCGSSATQKELRQAERISRRCFLPPRLHAAAGQNFPLSPIPSTIFSSHPPPPSAVQQGMATESAPPASATPGKRKRAASDDSIPNARQQPLPAGAYSSPPTYSLACTCRVHNVQHASIHPGSMPAAGIRSTCALYTSQPQQATCALPSQLAFRACCLYTVISFHITMPCTSPGRFSIAHAEELLHLLRQAPARSVSDCFQEIGFEEPHRLLESAVISGS